MKSFEVRFHGCKSTETVPYPVVDRVIGVKDYQAAKALVLKTWVVKDWKSVMELPSK